MEEQLSYLNLLNSSYPMDKNSLLFPEGGHLTFCTFSQSRLLQNINEPLTVHLYFHPLDLRVAYALKATWLAQTGRCDDGRDFNICH